MESNKLKNVVIEIEFPETTFNDEPSAIAKGTLVFKKDQQLLEILVQTEKVLYGGETIGLTPCDDEYTLEEIKELYGDIDYIDINEYESYDSIKFRSQFLIYFGEISKLENYKDMGELTAIICSTLADGLTSLGYDCTYNRNVDLHVRMEELKCY